MTADVDYDGGTRRSDLVMRISIAKLAAAALVIAASQGQVHAQSKADPEVAARIAILKDAVKDRKMARDEEAVEAIKHLGASYPKLASADQKKVVRAVTSALTTGRLRPPTRADVYLAASAALGQMGPGGSSQLHKVFTKKRFPNKPEWLFMRVELVRNIGNTKDRKMVKFLCDRISRTAHDKVLLAAGETMTNYADTDQKVREPIVKAMIAKLGALEAAKSMQVLRADTPQSLAILNAGETLELIAAPYNATLKALTHQSFENGNDWQRWYNKNKTKPWRAEKQR